MDRRGKKIAFAVVLVALAPILFVTGGSIVGVVFSGVAILTFGWIMSRPAGRQLIGNECRYCDGLITLEYEAEVCQECQAGLHARCVEAHRTKVHRASKEVR